MAGDPLGDRMKGYERAARSALTRRLPVIVRVDGKAFHTWTRGCARPFDDGLIAAMNAAACRLCEEMQGAALAFVQSDEISVLLHNYRRLASAAWFDNEVQKMVSVSASIAAAVLTSCSRAMFAEGERLAFFDARVFVLPESEVCNYFIWRQQDAARNSVQMMAQAIFSQRELHGCDTRELQEMIYQKTGQNWNDLPAHQKRGRCVVRETTGEGGAMRSTWGIDTYTPFFTTERAYIERHMAVEPEDREPLPRFGVEASDA
jgi:tRNA(His) guanylyltransferase